MNSPKPKVNLKETIHKALEEIGLTEGLVAKILEIHEVICGQPKHSQPHRLLTQEVDGLEPVLRVDEGLELSSFEEKELLLIRDLSCIAGYKMACFASKTVSCTVEAFSVKALKGMIVRPALQAWVDDINRVLREKELVRNHKPRGVKAEGLAVPTVRLLSHDFAHAAKSFDVLMPLVVVDKDFSFTITKELVNSALEAVTSEPNTPPRKRKMESGSTASCPKAMRQL